MAQTDRQRGAHRREPDGSRLVRVRGGRVDHTAHEELPGHCFAAAHAWAEAEGWTYCEGYALSPDPLLGAFEHAWCVRNGRVADPAIPDGWVLAYRGLPLSASFIRAQGRGHQSVITFGRELFPGLNTTVLREGLPADALVPRAPDASGAAHRPAPILPVQEV